MRPAIAFCVLVASLGGCASSVSHVARPVSLGSVSVPVPLHEVAEVCGSYRARRVHTPVFLSDGTPVRCF